MGEIYQKGNIKEIYDFAQFTKENIVQNLKFLNNLPNTEGIKIIGNNLYKSQLQFTELIIPEQKSIVENLIKSKLFNNKTPSDLE